MSPVISFPMMLVLIGQAATDTDADFAAASEARLAYMKESVLVYDIRSVDEPNVSYKLQPEPVLRFTNPVGRVRDGTVFLWLDGDGRPAVVAQATLNLKGTWVHEFSSLSPVRFTAVSSRGPTWTTKTAGVEFRPIPDAPSPAATAGERLRQMRALTREFTAEDDFEQKSWQPLRLLPKPFARYGREGAAVIDGALFSFALATDPEVYLMLEARLDKDVPVWQYAFARSTFYPVRASWKVKPVWEFNIERPAGWPIYTLYQLPYSKDKVSAEPKGP
jgi:hypothetical protein